MNWYKFSSIQEKISSGIKKILKSHPLFLNLMDDYEIDHSDIDNHLVIEFADLGDKYAEGNGEHIRLNNSLLTEDFFDKHFHFVSHEFWHWVKRRSEALHYFNDPEEIQSFVMAIAWELINKRSPEEATKKIYPIVSGHYKDDEEANRMWAQMFSKAREIAGVY